VYACVCVKSNGNALCTEAEYKKYDCCSDEEKDILKESLDENYKKVKKAALDVLANYRGKVCTIHVQYS